MRKECTPETNICKKKVLHLLLWLHFFFRHSCRCCKYNAERSRSRFPPYSSKNKELSTYVHGDFLFSFFCMKKSCRKARNKKERIKMLCRLKGLHSRMVDDLIKETCWFSRALCLVFLIYYLKIYFLLFETMNEYIHILTSTPTLFRDNFYSLFYLFLHCLFVYIIYPPIRPTLLSVL